MSRILIAEKDRSIQQVLDIALTHYGHNVVKAVSPREALQLVLDPEPIDLAIVGDFPPHLDHNLELVHDLRTATIGTSVPIIMVSTQCQPADLKMAEAAGATCYFTKPFVVREVVASVHEYLRAA